MAMAKILLICLGNVGQAMAGPAIRYWEFAKVLSKKHQVTLMVPNPPDISDDRFSIVVQNNQSTEYFKQADVIIAQQITHQLAWIAKSHGIKLILDAYDPMPLENLELFKAEPLPFRNNKQQRIVDRMNFSFQMADGVICANERQRNLWTGLLLSLKKISPSLYDADRSFKSFLDIVPFGLPSTPPEHAGNGLREMFKINKTDKVVLWGGGIWNWFDPLTLIEAIHQISRQRPDVHLVFMGLKHPDEAAPEMKMSREAVQLAKQLNIIGKHVHFNYGWVPYDQRANFLLEADIGVSTHFDHLETQYAFRTRMLDYIWAQLPIVATAGDSFADLIAAREIGLVVPPEDSKALAKAILQILDHPRTAAQMKKNLNAVREQFYWENVVKPIEGMVNSLTGTKSKGQRFTDFKCIFQSLYRTNGPAAIVRELRNRLLPYRNS